MRAKICWLNAEVLPSLFTLPLTLSVHTFISLALSVYISVALSTLCLTSIVYYVISLVFSTDILLALSTLLSH